VSCGLNNGTSLQPLLKKQGLCPDILTDSRPISCLPYVSNVIERVVLSRLQDHLHAVMDYDWRHHAYHSLHSSETGVTEVLISRQLSIQLLMIYSEESSPLLELLAKCTRG
jgi:hypothetical protein